MRWGLLAVVRIFSVIPVVVPWAVQPCRHRSAALLGCADNWSVKAMRRRTTGTGRMQYLRHMPRLFKNGFREGTYCSMAGQPYAVHLLRHVQEDPGLGGNEC